MTTEADSSSNLMGTATPELEARYDPHRVEARWARHWAERPFTADPGSDREPFVMMMPPPNVTGNLHLGHAFDNTIIDTLIRFRRMQGYEALFQPGVDHAGIATQVVVERELRRQGISRHDLGREEFLKRVWAWKEEYGDVILGQLHRLGISADWTRNRFTMDEGLSRAVRKQFVDLYHQGKIFRGERIVHWDPESRTTLSDLEVDREERQAALYTLAYELEDGGDIRDIRIATVRPETIFADTAIAVHPDDDRYSGLVGLRARIPLTERFVPIIADEAVERDFGTGALKITPAHDPTDFEIGERHGLPRPSVIGLDAKLTGELVPEAFRDIDRFEARPLVVQALRDSGALVAEKLHAVSLGLSQRTGQPVEPMVMLQWFYDTSEAAGRALAALDDGSMRVHPERYTKVNRDWLIRIRPWNISRQIWWGHRVPAWYDPDGNVIVPDPANPELDPTDDPRYAHLELTRDPDVFDTWFSSNLFPFSTLGWPDESDPAYRRFYPNSVLSCGFDILFFWVARMQIAGYDMTDRAPFSDILLHGMILDEHGQKMSKSKGNGVDPLIEIDKYGADALRFALCFVSTGAQDINWDERRLEMGRNFVTKLWNASRFALMNLPDGVPAGLPRDVGALSLPDRWILSRLQAACEQVGAELEQMELGLASRTAYDFVWSEFCDWYLEAAKPALKDGDPATRQVLGFVLRSIVSMLHPFLPFVTSELGGVLDPDAPEVGRGSWPDVPAALRDAAAESEFTALQDAVAALRALRIEAGLPASQKVTVYVDGPGAPRLRSAAASFESLARATVLDELPDGPALAQPTAGLELRLPLSGVVDVQEWRARQEKRLAGLRQDASKAAAKLGNEGFTSRAPVEVVAEERRKLQEAEAVIARLESILAQLV